MVQLNIWLKDNRRHLESFLQKKGVEQIFLKCKEDGEAYVYLPIANDNEKFTFYREFKQWLKETHHITTLITRVDEEMSNDLQLESIQAIKINITSTKEKAANHNPQVSHSPPSPLFRSNEQQKPFISVN